jgi:hypothetical protein
MQSPRSMQNCCKYARRISAVLKTMPVTVIVKRWSRDTVDCPHGGQ